jgi:hypothetical protein
MPTHAAPEVIFLKPMTSEEAETLRYNLPSYNCGGGYEVTFADGYQRWWSEDLARNAK